MNDEKSNCNQGLSFDGKEVAELEVTYKESWDECESNLEKEGRVSDNLSSVSASLSRLIVRSEEIRGMIDVAKEHLESKLQEQASYKQSADEDDIDSLKQGEPSIATKLGMVVSDFLIGFSRDQNNPYNEDIGDLIKSIKCFIDRSDFSDVKDSPLFKRILYYLSEKVKSEDDAPLFQIDFDISHNKDEHVPHPYQSSSYNPSYSSKSDTIRTVGGEISRAEWEKRRRAEKEERDRQNALHDATREAIRYSELAAIRAEREEKERNEMVERFRRKHLK